MMRRRNSPDLSRTPGFEQLERHHREAVARKDQVARKCYANHAAVAASQPPTTASPTGTDQRDQDDEETQVPDAEEEKFSKKLTPFQQRVLEIFTEGNQNHRDIAAIMTASGEFGNVSTDATYKALVTLDALGYIQRPKRSNG